MAQTTTNDRLKAFVIIGTAIVCGIIIVANNGNDKKKDWTPASSLTSASDSNADITCTTQPVAFKTITQNDPSVEIGQSWIQTPGENGTEEYCTHADGTFASRKTTSEPIAQIKIVGTKLKPVYVPPAPAASYSDDYDCNPNYDPCIPDAPYDLDCSDVGEQVEVIGYDEYNLDGDNDGIGCESY
jgi:hypothetical protein